jgi:hypothetical protein
MMQTVLRRRPRLAIVLFALATVTLDVAMSPAAQPLKAAELATQTNREGMVTIKVTPQALFASATELRFEVVLDTHSVALAQDMRDVAVLSGGAGSEYKPTAWDGDPPGGHHRKGMLVFAPVSPMPASLTLTIRGIGGVPERIFTWSVSP